MKHLKKMLTVALVLQTVSAFCQNVKVDSLLLNSSDSSKRARYTLLRASLNDCLERDPYCAQIYATEYLKLAKEIGDPLLIARSYIGNSYALKAIGKNRQAIDSAKKGLVVASSNGLLMQEWVLLNDMSVAARNLGSLDESLDFNFQSLLLRLKSGDSTALSVAYNNIGVVYDDIGDHQNALKFYQMALNTKLKNKIDHDLQMAYANISISLISLNRLDEGFEYANKARIVCDSACNPRNQFPTNYAFGKYYQKIGEFDKSRDYFLRCLTVAEKYRRIKEITDSQLAFAGSYHDQGMDSLSLKYLNMASSVVSNTDFESSKRELYRLYHKVYKGMGDLKNALHYADELLVLNSRILNGNTIRKLTETTLEFSQRENLKIITSQNEIIDLSKETIRQQRTITIITIALCVVSAGVVVLLFRMITIRGRVNQLLNKKVRERTLELTNRNTQLNRQTFEQSAVLQRLNDQLLASLATLSGLIQVAQSDIGDKEVRNHLKRMEDETRKLKTNTSVFLKQRPGAEKSVQIA